MPATAPIHAGMTWLLRSERRGTSHLGWVGCAGWVDIGDGRFSRLTNRACHVRGVHEWIGPIIEPIYNKVRPLTRPGKWDESTRNHPPDPAKTTLLIPLKRRFFDGFASWNSGIAKKIAFL